MIRERRRFICDARAISAGTIDISPTLRIGIVSGFGLFRQISRHDIKARALSLSVMTLPDTGKPGNFSGAIGQFSIESALSSGTAAVGDLVNITTTIRGKGYLDPVSPISIPASPSFKVYPPKAVPTPDTNVRTFEQTVIPQSTNALVIPAISFCYFDPQEGEYRTISGPPFSISIVPHRKTATQAIYKPDLPPKSGHDSAILYSSARKTYSGKIRNMRITAIAVYWIVIITLSLVLTVRYSRGSIAAVILIITAAILFLPLRSFLVSSISEATVTRNEKARLAPAHTSIVCFDIARDSQVRILDHHGSWVKVECNDRRGWMSLDSLTNVSPARTEIE
jgi:hypothetical protein